MDEPAHAVEVCFEVDADADRYGELIHRVAQESCHDGRGVVDTDASFVMVTTEMREDVMVKTVVFERQDCAQRFRMLLTRAEPGLAPTG
ncbi:MAG: hypothetical protein MI723_12160 [Caulobacterales bacterium]|nr:hypothetical protein [Caulobacterales bacterium]